MIFKTGEAWGSGGRLVHRAGGGYAVVFALRERGSDWGDGIVGHGREECEDERFQACFLTLDGVSSPNNMGNYILADAGVDCRL